MTRGAVLGLSGFYHDSAACLVVDGEVAVALQEERESRRKHDSGFPVLAARRCLETAGLDVAALDLVTWYELPYLHAERVIHSQIRFAPRGLRAFPHVARALVSGKLAIEREIGEALGYVGPVLCVPHHVAHAASAFLPSPFDEAAILTVDGVGEWATTSLGVGRQARVELLEEQRFPHSLGLFYASITAWCGLRVNSGEYKLMGLAPYGRSRFREAMRELVHVGEDGSVRLNLRHFDFPAGLSMARPSAAAFLGGPAHPTGAPLGQREADLAASAQAVVEEALCAMARHARERTGLRRLVMAGGVALNCVAVGQILASQIMEDVFVQPAAGDAGGALGAALVGAQELDARARPTRAAGGDAMRGALLGPAVSEAEIRDTLERAALVFERLEDTAMDGAVADALVAGEVVGWFQGRMEFGPRALGARSILADPRGPSVRDRVNREMKHREGYRPFAPAVLEAEAARHFVLEGSAPYMTRTVSVRSFRGAAPRDAARPSVESWTIDSDLPAVTHVDGSARVQTVDATRSPRLFSLLTAFHARTGLPVLLNTSFNLRGEPLVSRPDDAVRTFAHSGLEVLAIGPFLVRRSEQAVAALSRIPTPLLTED